MANILVIASSSALANSLRFALEAEGHRVDLRSSFDAIGEGPDAFACTVFDHHAAAHRQQAAADFLIRFRPAVLLANDGRHMLSAYSYRTVTKPHLGAPLLTAVEEAVAASGAAH